ncbi:MAG: hypothetical protein ACK55Z_07540, partial [bacterium]
RPQRRPSQKPCRRFPHDNCARAHMWSAPVSTCTAPSVTPSKTSSGISISLSSICEAPWPWLPPRRSISRANPLV